MKKSGVSAVVNYQLNAPRERASAVTHALALAYHGKLLNIPLSEEWNNGKGRAKQ